nr:hypothetical protein [Paenibacillus apii]
MDDLFGKLSEGGQVFMPLDKYPFSDKFGVTWQLNLLGKQQ